MARSTEVCFKTSYVCFCACDRLYIAFSVLFVVRHALEKYFPVTPPPHPSEITAFESPLPPGISDDLPWGGGGVWIFSETTRSFLQYLVCIALSPANLISSCVSGCKDAKKVSFTAGHLRSCNYHVSGSYVCKKFPSWGRCTFWPQNI